MDISTSQNTKTNIPLLIFDLIFFPLTVLRLSIIYFFGSRYNLYGLRILDLMHHATNPYFNQNDKKNIETIEDDYRIIIRDDSRIYPVDITKYLKVNNNKIIIGQITDQSDNNDDIVDNIKKELNSIFV